MLLPRLALGGFLLRLPLASHAQSAEPAPYPRFYAGLAAYSSYYQPLGGGYRSTRVPLQLTAGYQWRPRLAVQAGVAYSGTSYSYFTKGYTYTGTGTPGTYFEYQGRDTRRNTSVSLLARYTLTRKPTHRVQFDLLAGFTWEHGSYRHTGTSTDSVQNKLVITPYDERYADNSLLLSAGPSLRYHFSRQLELVYDLTFNTRLLSSQPYQIKGLTGSSALGLRYRFGRR